MSEQKIKKSDEEKQKKEDLKLNKKDIEDIEKDDEIVIQVEKIEKKEQDKVEKKTEREKKAKRETGGETGKGTEQNIKEEIHVKEPKEIEQQRIKEEKEKESAKERKEERENKLEKRKQKIEELKTETLKQIKLKEEQRDSIQEVLEGLGLRGAEIELYMECEGKGPISLGEMSLLVSIPPKDTEKIAQNLVKKRLFREIQGTIHYYEALPPYAAIIDQLVKFDTFLTEMNQTIPQDLMEKFEEIKQNSTGIKNLGDFNQNLVKIFDYATDSLETQRDNIYKGLKTLQEQTNVVPQITSLRNNLIDLIEREVENLEKNFKFIETKVSRNLEKLHLGVIKKTVESMFSDILESELNKIHDDMESRFVSAFKLIINAVINKVREIPEQIEDVTTHVKDVFDESEKEFTGTLEDAQTDVGDMTEQINEAFKELQENFSDKILKTLTDLITKIKGRIRLSSSAIAQFWNQAQEKKVFSMTNVWFIQSEKGMKAQIKKSLSDTKMRILIVAPQLTDIDVEPLIDAPTHVQIRITSAIDPSEEKQKKILTKLKPHHNILIRRQRKEHALWGMHKDYEEVVVGFVNYTRTDGKMEREVVGIGSIVKEHLKAFVPILEDAWVGASKDISVATQQKSLAAEAIKKMQETFEGSKKVHEDKKRKKQQKKQIQAVQKQAHKAAEDEIQTQEGEKNATETDEIPEKIQEINRRLFFLEKQLSDLSIIQIAQKLPEIYHKIENLDKFPEIMNKMKEWEERLHSEPQFTKELHNYFSKEIKSWITQLKEG